MKKSQFSSLIFLLVLTVFFTLVIRELLFFAYEEYNQTDSYAIIKTITYIRLYPTLLLLSVSVIYAGSMVLLLKVVFKNFDKKLLFQFGFLIFIWVFLNGIIGSYNGIRDYQVRKCNKNIQKCLNEEELINHKELRKVENQGVD